MANNKKKIDISKIILLYFCVPFFTIIIGVLIFIILFKQESFLFHPIHDEKAYTYLKNIDMFEEVNLTSGDMILNGWLKYDNENKNEEKPLLIAFFGNADNTSAVLANFYQSNIFKNFEGYNIISFDYPKFGLSKGKISDENYAMSLMIYEYVMELECVNKENISVLGFSIGTGPAIYLASKKDVSGLILIAPYDNALNLYNDRLNIFYGPLKLLTKYKINGTKTSEKYRKIWGDQLYGMVLRLHEADKMAH